MNVKYKNAKDIEFNPTLKEVVEKENPLKDVLVKHVGEVINPEDNNVTVEMIVEVMARDFPEFILAIAEENWVRGYQQALDDVDTGKQLIEYGRETSNDQQEEH